MKSSRTCRGQILEDQEEDHILSSRPTCPRGLNITAEKQAWVRNCK